MPFLHSSMLPSFNTIYRFPNVNFFVSFIASKTYTYFPLNVDVNLSFVTCYQRWFTTGKRSPPPFKLSLYLRYTDPRLPPSTSKLVKMSEYVIILQTAGEKKIFALLFGIYYIPGILITASKFIKKLIPQNTSVR